MPIISQIICDGCQAVKKETNHWYTLVIDEAQQACLRPMAGTPATLLKPGTQGVQFLCGRHCAIGALDMWMDGMTTPGPQACREQVPA